MKRTRSKNVVKQSTHEQIMHRESKTGKYLWKSVCRGKFLIGFMLISMSYLLLIQLQTNNKDNSIQSPLVIRNDHQHMKINYTLSPIAETQFGAFITGIDVCDSDKSIDTIISQLIYDIYKYKFVILKRQCNSNQYTIPSNILTNLADKFGEISRFRNPNQLLNGTNISVFSNDPSKGAITPDSQSWHIDGLWDAIPKTICFQHIIKIPNNPHINGGTQIVDSTAMLKLLKQIKPELYNKLRKLYVVYMAVELGYQIIFPFIAIQPFTNEEYIMANLLPNNIRHLIEVNDKTFIDELMLLSRNINGVKVVKFNKKIKIKYFNDSRIKFYKRKEIENLRIIMDRFIDNECKNNNLYYYTQYEKGDLLIRDNLLLLHASHPTSYMSVNDVGLRILWRICINGKEYPISTF